MFILPLIVFLLLGYILACILQRNDIVDSIWGMGFILVALISFLQSDLSPAFIKALPLILVLIWGIRLSYRMSKRFITSKDEDYRYKEWREEWMKKGKVYFYLRSLFQVFLLQGFFLSIIVTPIVLFYSAESINLNLISILGILVWLTGFYFESVGDWQLDSFLKKKKTGEIQEKILQTGLWKYTRHPNYFGEVTMWWGIFILTISTAQNLLTIISPIVITWLLVKVSGVPMLEEQWKDDPEFQDYKKKTPGFFPRFW